MKQILKINLIAIILICLNSIAFANNDSKVIDKNNIINTKTMSDIQIFDTANKLYNKQKYNEAIELYSILNKNQAYESFAIYYNLANSYYRSGEYVYAILFYERALKLNPNKEEIKHNLKLAQNRTIDKFDTLPSFFLSTWCLSFVNLFALNTWAIIFIILIAFILTCLLLYFIGKTYTQKQIAFWSCFIGITASIIVLSACTYSYIDSNKLEAIVIQNKIEVKSSPETNGNTKFILHSGSKVSIIDAIPPFYKIKIKDGNTGWVKENELEII